MGFRAARGYATFCVSRKFTHVSRKFYVTNSRNGIRTRRYVSKRTYQEIVLRAHISETKLF